MAAFQGALRSGDVEAARSHLTKNPILRVANRPEVSGSQAIFETLFKLFATEFRPTNASTIQMWEPDGNSLIVEMTVQAHRVADGKNVEYPCVETYRFEGDKISEWRVYPAEPTLLAAESRVAQTT